MIGSLLQLVEYTDEDMRRMAIKTIEKYIDNIMLMYYVNVSCTS